MGALSTVFDEAYANPEEWVIFSDEFLSTLETAKWSTVKDSSAAAATGDASNGALTLTSQATTDNDGALVQSANEIVLPTDGKRFCLEGRVKDSDADQTDLFFGLSQKAATDPENILAASNRIGFQIDDGNASILCKTEATDVETSSDSEIDLADDTYVKLAIYYDGAGVVSFYVNDVLKRTHSTNIPATELAIAMFHLSGSASGTRTSVWDYVRLAVER